MDFLNKIGLSRFWEKIKGRMILSETIRKIVVVDEYPSVEEEGVLYLKKDSSSILPEPGTENLISLGTKGHFRPSESLGVVNIYSNYNSVAIPVEINATYKITTDIILERFQACLLDVSVIEEGSAINNLIKNDTGQEITIQTTDTSKWLLILYHRDDDAITEEEAYNALKVVKNGA